MDKQFVTIGNPKWDNYFDNPTTRLAFQTAERVIRAHSRTFYFATALLPPQARQAIRSLYGFCRASDDLADKEGATLEELERWKAETARPPHLQTDPVLIAWSLIRERYQVDRRYETELIEGIQWDVAARRYPDWPALAEYCYRVASTVGLMSIPIIGLAPGVRFEDAAPFAIKLGQALQLTNILRDIGEDATHNRVYIPTADLAAFNLTERDLLNGVQDERFEALMRFEIQRARQLYTESLPGIALLSRSARPAVGAAALLYRAILDEIEAVGYRVHHYRAHTNGWKKLRMLPRILYTVYTI